MNRTRTWVLIVAMSCFGAGVAVGLVAPDVVDALFTEEVLDADEYFVHEYIEELGLTSQQADTLRMILAAREQEEIAAIKSFGNELPDGLLTLLKNAGDLADRRIQVILDEEQKKRFKALLDERGKRWPRP